MTKIWKKQGQPISPLETADGEWIVKRVIGLQITMEKRLMNTEKWSLFFILLYCFNPIDIRQRSVSRGQSPIGLQLVDVLGNLLANKNNEKKRNGVAEGEFRKTKFSGGEELNGYKFGEEFYQRDLTVYILPDIRRTAPGNDNLAGISSNQELSLADSEAIDFYWRQDIDAEKDVYPNLWTPDLQDERDVQMVTEKSLLQQGYPSSGLPYYSYFDRQGDVVREYFIPKEYATLETPPYQAIEEKDLWQIEKPTFQVETAATHGQQEPSLSNASGNQNANDELNLGWLNLTSGDPLNDVFLHSSGSAGQDANAGNPTSEYQLINPTTGDINTPPVSMEWESKPADPAVVEQENRVDPALMADLLQNCDFDTLPTPELELVPNDVARIFGNQQVAQDVAEAQSSKEVLLRQSPFAVADVSQTATDSTLMQYLSPIYDENFMTGTEQSEVILEPIYEQPESMQLPSATWVQSEPTSVHWNSHLPSDTSNSASVSSISPPWTGDHDYVLDPFQIRQSSGGRNRFGDEWPIGESGMVKLEESDVDGEDDDEETEDGSNEENGRVASERDELRARQLNLPFTAADIVQMPQSEYTKLTRETRRFTKDQIELMKEIRRHGGNKEAARRSRQKKVQTAKALGEEVKELERERHSAMMEYKKLRNEIENEEKAIENLKRRN